MNKQSGKKKLFSFSNIFLGLAIVFVLLLLFVPDFKAGVIRDLMKIGIFQPKIERQHIPSPLSEGYAQNMLLTNADGDTISLAAFKGNVLFINVWATWCAPCKAELPSIATLKENSAHNANIKIITIDADGRPIQAKNFLRKHGIKLPVWAVVGGRPRFLIAKGIPFTVILDKKGFIAFRHLGVSDYSGHNFSDFLKKLAKE